MKAVRPHIVIIGKEAQVLQFLEGRFSSGFAVSKASTFAEGVGIVEKLKPLAVILDAEGTALELVAQVEQLQKSGNGSLVWVVCPKTEYGIAKKSLLAGADGYVFKPYSLGDWEKVLQKISKTNITSDERKLARMEAIKGLPGSNVSVNEMRASGQTYIVKEIERITKEKAVLCGIAAGLGYFSIPFFVMMILFSKEWEFFLNHGGIYSMVSAALDLYAFTSPISFPIGAISIAVSVLLLIRKKYISRLDSIAIAMGSVFLVCIVVALGGK